MTISSSIVVRGFLRAWVHGDDVELRRILAEDVTFDSPMLHTTGRDSVAAAMLDFARLVDDITILAIADIPSGAIVMYDMHTAPFGMIRAAEWYEIRDGRIIHDRLVFDTAALRP